MVDNNNNNNNNIYYFLGNFSQHISHVLPLYRDIGGTVVVVSRKTEKELSRYSGIKVLCIDDKPRFWLNINRSKDNDISKTINYLNKFADIVVLYDAFYWEAEDMRVLKPTIFLGHGNGSSKTVLQRLNNDGRWGKQLNNMTKVSSLGRDTERMFIDNGVSRDKLVRLNTVRTDEIIEKLHDKLSKESAQKTLKLNTSLRTVAYMPTYWGPTSVMDVGILIMRNISDEYNLLFWPHPQTPKEVLSEYCKIASGRKNVFLPQGNKHIEISDIYNVADIFIVDHTTSVVSDIMITKKPVIYSFGSGDYRDYTLDKSPIRFAVNHSWNLNENNVGDIDNILFNTMTLRYVLKEKILNTVSVRQFVWMPRGGARKRTIKTIKTLIKEGRKTYNSIMGSMIRPFL